MPDLDLPYFDRILVVLERQPDAGVELGLLHQHWGYFESADSPDDSVPASVKASEELTRRIAEAGRVGNGLRILDVGCGFGTAIDYLDRHLSSCELVGLNIDERQLAVARQWVKGGSGNEVTFIEGDACRLPFGDREFDVVLAIECIFHFESRKRFFGEVSRVLEPGGHLALSDFLLNSATFLLFTAWMNSGNAPESQFFGGSNLPPITPRAYSRLARKTGFCGLVDEDVTENTMPTYPALRRLYQAAAWRDGEQAVDYLEELARRRFLEYHILAFSSSG